MYSTLLIETDNSMTFSTKIWECGKTNVIHINDELTELAAKLHLSDEHMEVIVRQYAFFTGGRKAVRIYCTVWLYLNVLFFRAVCSMLV